jgi:indolepyruvate ferredoxin oxidoreductase alpha subunit
MQERSHAFAMKSQIWLLDPRPNLPCIVRAVKQGFALSEASHTPVMLQLRIRACHVHGEFIAADNVRPSFTLADAMQHPRRDTERIVLPPASFVHEQEKVRERWPAALRYIEQHAFNEFFAEGSDDIGIVVQGGNYNTLLRVLERLGVADVYGASRVPLYVMNVAYPVIDREVLRFCEGKRAVLLVEEGQPNFVEQNVATILRQAGSTTALHGKDMLPMAGEYTAAEVLKGARAFLERYGRIAPQARAPAPPKKLIPLKALTDSVHGRPPGFCTGCPERPIFTAMKLVERELGAHHVSADIGCHLFSILPPFNLGNTTMGYGLGAAGASAFNVATAAVPATNGASDAGVRSKRAISVMGDGGFWHNGLTSGIANAVFNRSDNLTIVVDNSYTSATGGQDILSSTAHNPTRDTGHAIEAAVRGVGVNWVRTMRRTYDVAGMRDALREALTTTHKGPKVLIAQSECMLNKQRREKPLQRKAIAAGQRVVRERFGVDADTCTGDHSCIRLSGCPSLSVKPNPDPLRTDPVATVLDSCVGCGLCGEVSHAAVLCPSFYRAQIVSNPTRGDRWRQRARGAVIGWLQRRRAEASARYAF